MQQILLLNTAVKCVFCASNCIIVDICGRLCEKVHVPKNTTIATTGSRLLIAFFSKLSSTKLSYKNTSNFKTEYVESIDLRCYLQHFYWSFIL